MDALKVFGWHISKHSLTALMFLDALLPSLRICMSIMITLMIITFLKCNHTKMSLLPTPCSPRPLLIPCNDARIQLQSGTGISINGVSQVARYADQIWQIRSTKTTYRRVRYINLNTTFSFRSIRSDLPVVAVRFSISDYQCSNCPSMCTGMFATWAR